MAILLALALISTVAITLIISALLISLLLEGKRRDSWEASIESAFPHGFLPNLIPWLDGCAVCGHKQGEPVHR